METLLKYKIDVLLALKNKGYSTYKIRNEKIFNQTQLQDIRKNHLLTHAALDKLCRLLECQPGDILEWVPDEEGEKNE